MTASDELARFAERIRGQRPPMDEYDPDAPSERQRRVVLALIAEVWAGREYDNLRHFDSSPLTRNLVTTADALAVWKCAQVETDTALKEQADDRK